MKLPDEKTRQYLYNVATVCAPLLVVYGILEIETIGLWLAAVGAVLGLSGTGLAAVTLHKQRHDGMFDRDPADNAGE